MNIGQSVRLIAPGVLSDQGDLIPEGTKGVVVGNKGFGEVVVSWNMSGGDHQYATVPTTDVTPTSHLRQS